MLAESEPLLRPPASLSEAERSIWVHVITAAEPEHFRPGDEPLLMRFWEVLPHAITPPRKLHRSAKGRMPSPWLSTQERLLKMLVVLCRQLRLSPLARTPHRDGRPAAVDPYGNGHAMSAYERMALMTPNDLAALKLAMEHANKEPARAAQLRSMLKDASWIEVAEFAAYGCQNRSLHLLPWELPPCHGDSEHHPDPGSEKVAGSNVGRWHLALSSQPDGGARSGEAEGCRVIS